MPKYQDYIYVVLQFVLFIIYFLPVKIVATNVHHWVQFMGLIAAALGALLGVVALLQLHTKLSPFPTPCAGSTLRTTGAYAIARHPVYTSLASIAFGHAIYQESIYQMLIALLLLALFYFKSKYEEQLLEKKFASYQEYKKQTRRFL
ncbi:MAG: isoprenylcysteine carboxylmethyltransferase family protein [Leeuwenhoekiella sp.]